MHVGSFIVYINRLSVITQDFSLPTLQMINLLAKLSVFILLVLLSSSQAVFGIRFVIDREECFSHNVEYDGDTVHVSFVVIKSDAAWHYSEDGVDLVVSSSVLLKCFLLFWNSQFTCGPFIKYVIPPVHHMMTLVFALPTAESHTSPTHLLYGKATVPLF